MKIRLPSKITVELAEETGWHIGDGSMNIYNHKDGRPRGFYQLRGHIEDDVAHYKRRIKPLFKKIYDIEINLRKMPKTRVFGFQIWNCDLVKFKQKLGLSLGKKLDVCIPEIFLEEDQLLRAVVRGIFDTDGGIYLDSNRNNYPICYITTISRNLSDQIKNALDSWKISSTVTSFNNIRGNRKIAFRVNIRGNRNCSEFLQIINPLNPKFKEKINKISRSKRLIN